MSECPFHIKPKHWWQYLNPFWWRTKRWVEAIMAYQWSNEGMHKRVEEAVKNTMLYGDSLGPDAWKTDDEQEPNP